MGVKGKGTNTADGKKSLECVAGFFRISNEEPSRKEKLKTDRYTVHTVDIDPAKFKV
jgi:hypothetical protein